MRFPYIKERGKFVPIIPVSLKGKKEWITFDAFVDSGASYSIFKPEIAQILGTNYKNGKKTKIIVGDGSLITVYLHKIKMRIEKKEFQAIIGFSKELGIGFNIIGRKNIFEKFKVCFNEKNKTVEFLPQ